MVSFTVPRTWSFNFILLLIFPEVVAKTQNHAQQNERFECFSIQSISDLIRGGGGDKEEILPS